MITFHLMELDCIRGTSQYITQDTFGDTITTNMHNFNYAINLEFWNISCLGEWGAMIRLQ